MINSTYINNGSFLKHLSNSLHVPRWLRNNILNNLLNVLKKQQIC